ncbi:MAG: nuclear transport factor 2 family protein [Rhizobium sp.]|nr:nuclear transport factor 2 family protein [Rhizobium sp.]
MPQNFPRPVEDYFAGKNSGDFAAALSGFAEDAVVSDENRAYEGRQAIRNWMEETRARYNDRSVVRDFTVEGDTVVVYAEVSGTFPGSPITLRYRFTLTGGSFCRLEIGA